ncbi:hypothetical protein FVO59_04630 [Microbacterium esteraromaticum]|uniref:NUDIX hydrolase n=1 Tax=Microbacterium esteraromaticum TaxID=57043 RepID=A0A7D7WG00_9MICO|nr:hypothetical protein [Microbacterium esteraromaticum]QMU96574.1 hypothetical protein FVO59_04630 [Microbacterium esteraromaticum]
MSDERLIATVPAAPWLPHGSHAEAWAGHECLVPDPCIIVRLLLVRHTTRGVEFFCVPTPRGLDLPSLPLSAGSAGVSTTEGVSSLASKTLGRADIEHRCVGYIRNVVPEGDADYPHPKPWAHVPVFVPTKGTEPVCEGSWVSLDDARPELQGRHWLPIVEHHLSTFATR